jgi:hypothetical protein
MIMPTIVLRQRDLFTKRFRNVPTIEPTELQIHIAVVARLRLQCRPGVEWWHTPNGPHLRADDDKENKTDARQGAKLKAMGLRPGVSDLLFAWDDNGRLRMMLLELKARGRDLSPAQRDFKTSMKAIGAYFEMADTIDEAFRVLRQYRILPR